MVVCGVYNDRETVTRLAVQPACPREDTVSVINGTKRKWARLNALHRSCRLNRRFPPYRQIRH